MNSLFPVSQTYEVSALVSRVSMDESAIIRKGDEIRPFFVQSVEDDQDLRGLKIVLKNSSGLEVGAPYLYQTKVSPAKAPPGEETGTPDFAGTKTSSAELPPGGESAKPNLSRPQVSFEEAPLDGETGTLNSDRTKAASAEVSSGGENGKSDLYRTDVFPAGVPFINENGNPEENPKNERLFYVNRMDVQLPAFSLPETLKPGAYVMSFEVFGEDQIAIARNEISFYYLADSSYDLGDIKISLPGYSPEPHLVPPGTPVLLEAGISADPGLEPYIVWYNGKTRIMEGRCFPGTAGFLWDAPLNTSFLNLRAELVPFPPAAGRNSSASSSQKTLRGKAKTLSLPVSAKAAIPGKAAPLIEIAGAGENAWTLHHFRFEGDLTDDSGESEFRPSAEGNAADKNPLWISFGDIYGLASGPRDVYSSSPFSTAAEKEKRSRFRTILNFKYLSDGVLFSVCWSGGRIELSAKNESLVIGIYAEGRSVEAPVPLTGQAEYITLPLDFIFGNTDVEAVLEGASVYLDTLPENFSGTAFFRLGGSSSSNGAGTVRASGGKSGTVLPVMILDELALIRFPDISAAGAAAEPDLSGKDSARGVDVRPPPPDYERAR